MGLEQKDSSPLSSIHIDLEPPAITFTGADGRAITFHPVDYLRRLLAATAFSRETLQKGFDRYWAEADSPTPAEALEPAKETLITLAGKLKTRVQEGFPDAKGRPTATALFAAHLPESQDAKMYFA